MAESNEMLGQGCGCYIQAHGTWITYCPMHKAAPEMLAALEIALQLVGSVPEFGPITHPWRKLIAQARGQPQEAK